MGNLEHAFKNQQLLLLPFSDLMSIRLSHRDSYLATCDLNPVTIFFLTLCFSKKI